MTQQDERHDYATPHSPPRPERVVPSELRELADQIERGDKWIEQYSVTALPIKGDRWHLIVRDSDDKATE